MDKNLRRGLEWTLLAFIIGIGISYTIIAIGIRYEIEVGKPAYRVVHSQKQEPVVRPIVKENKIVLHNVLVGTSSTSQKIIDNRKIFRQILSDSLRIEDTVSIGFVGDIVPGLHARSDLFSGVSAYTERPDIMIGNLEGVISQSENSKCKFNFSNCFSFKGDDNFLKLLSSASFDVLNTANNHFNDYGPSGREETIKKIQEAGMGASGIKDTITYVSTNNLVVAVVGFSTYWWTTDMNNEEILERIVSEANQNADIVVVIFHGGGEGGQYARTPHTTEWYLNENRGDVRDFAHKSIDFGADMVLGSGPHVLRGIEKYKNKLIAYSLGNFASADSRILTTGSLKTSAMIEITLSRSGSFVSGTVIPFEIDSLMIPHLDADKTAISSMNDLSQSDFGQQGVVLDSLGKIMWR